MNNNEYSTVGIDGKIITWHVTREQLELMSCGHKDATDKFFEDNFLHLKFFAGCLIRGRECLFTRDDLVNQLYVDIRTGKIIFDFYNRAINAAIYHSMFYAPVNGFEGVYVHKLYRSEIGAKHIEEVIRRRQAQ